MGFAMEFARPALVALEDVAYRGPVRGPRGETALKCAAALEGRKNSKAAQRHRARRAGFRAVSRNGEMLK